MVVVEQAYLKEINIRQVRHLKNIKIELSKNEKKHLLLTGMIKWYRKWRDQRIA